MLLNMVKNALKTMIKYWVLEGGWGWEGEWRGGGLSSELYGITFTQTAITKDRS